MFSLVGLILLGLILALDIIALIALLKSGADGETKTLWVLLIVLLPVIGMILYVVIGPRRQAARTALRLLVGFLAALEFWSLFAVPYERAVAPAAEFLLRLGESPAVTRLEAPGREFLVNRTDFPPAAPHPGLPSADLHFNFVLLASLFALHPHPWKTDRVARFLIAALCLYLVHVVFLVFEVESVYATRMGDWSAAHYGPAARNFWAAGFHFYQIAGRFAAPFAIWWLLGRAESAGPPENPRGPRRRKKKRA